MRRNSNTLIALLISLVLVGSGCDVFFPGWNRDRTPAPAPAPKPDDVQPDLGIKDPHGIRTITKAAGLELKKSELLLLYGAFDAMSTMLSTGSVTSQNSLQVNTLVNKALGAAGWEKTDGSAMRKAIDGAQASYGVDGAKPLAECKQALIDMYRLLAAGVSDAYKEVDGGPKQTPRLGG